MPSVDKPPILDLVDYVTMILAPETSIPEAFDRARLQDHGLQDFLF